MFTPQNVANTQDTYQWTRYSQRPSYGLNDNPSTVESAIRRGDNTNTPGYQPGSMRTRQDRSYSERNPSPGSRLSHRLSAVAGREGLRRCQLTLQRALHKCTDADCQDFACVIACLLSNFRRLQVSELRSAVAMHAFAQRSETLWVDRTIPEFRAWLVNFGILFHVDNDDCVSFGVSEMPHFLRNFRIRGIDASHRTIAMISLAFIEMTSSERPPGMPLDFLHYSEEHWQHHYHIAARTSICLRYDKLIRQRSKFVKRQPLDHSRRRVDTPPLNMVQRQFQTMDIDCDEDDEETEEEEDWVFVEK